MNYSAGMASSPTAQPNTQGYGMLMRYLQSLGSTGAAGAGSNPLAGTTYDALGDTMMAPTALSGAMGDLGMNYVAGPAMAGAAAAGSSY